MKVIESENILVSFSKQPMIIFEFLNGILLVIWGSVIFIKRQDDIETILIFILLLSIAFLIFWVFWSYRIVIQNGMLTYFSAFSRPKSIRLSDIERAEVKIKFDIHGQEGGGPPVKLIIYPKFETGMEDFYIHIKMLDGKGLQKVLNLLPIEPGSKKNIKDISVIKSFIEKDK